MKDFRPPQLGHTLMLFLAIIIIAILMFIVSSADAQEAIVPCPYGDSEMGSTVELLGDGGVTFFGILQGISSDCTYNVTIGGLAFIFTKDDALSSFYSVNYSPWCWVQSGTYSLKFPGVVKEVQVLYAIAGSNNDCWVQTEDARYDFETFVLYTNNQIFDISYISLGSFRQSEMLESWRIAFSTRGTIPEAPIELIGFAVAGETQDAIVVCMISTGCPGKFLSATTISVAEDVFFVGNLHPSEVVDVFTLFYRENYSKEINVVYPQILP